MMVSRSGARMTESRSDVYGYNDRNELVSAGRDALVASAPEYEYSYDDIGNRLSSVEAGTGNGRYKLTRDCISIMFLHCGVMIFSTGFGMEKLTFRLQIEIYLRLGCLDCIDVCRSSLKVLSL